MTHRQRVLAVLRYGNYDQLPLVHFGFWGKTLQKWVSQDHITPDEAHTWDDGNPTDKILSEKLGFDFNWYSVFHPTTGLDPGFEFKVIEAFPDGSQHMLDGNGVIVLIKPGVVSIPTEIRHTLVDRTSWEQQYKWRLQFSPERITQARVRTGETMCPFDCGGLNFLQTDQRDYPYGLFCGSLYGHIRDILGVEGACYLMADDEDLFDEIIETIGDLCYQVTKFILETGAKFDFGHFWEDICFKNGPLISPGVFEKKVGPHYRKITDLLKQYHIDIVSLDCDGQIDALLPTWFANGVNTMFPIEVGTWDASIAPWRQQYGRELRGVGGMNKVIFSRDRAAVDAEIERLKPLVNLGGYIPCPDHRIAPDAEWDLVRYYCDRMKKVFS